MSDIRWGAKRAASVRRFVAPARHGGAPRPPGERGERGLTLLELVIAMTVFALMMLGVAATVDTAMVLTRNNRNRSIASNLASQEMDLVRSSDFVSLQAGSSVQAVDGVDYTVSRELTWVPKEATNGPCDGSSGNPQVLRVRVSVSWPDMKGVPAAAADTVLTPPVGAYDPNTGHVAVKVLDRDALPSFMSTVYVSGPESRNLPTNSEGCAFFAFLTPGTYAVSLGGSGQVDRQGSPTPSQTVGVSIGVTASAQFDYDAAATLELTLTPNAGGAIPADLPLTVWNPALLPSGSKTFPGSGTTQAVGNLFPFLDGYQVWSGSCADADPEGQQIDPYSGSQIGPYWPDAQRDAALSTNPGGTTAGTARVSSFAIDVLDQYGAPAVDQEVVANHPVDHVCASGETHVLGRTDAAGHLDAALPFGTWQVTVTGRTPNGDWPTVVLDPTAVEVPQTLVNLL